MFSIIARMAITIDTEVFHAHLKKVHENVIFFSNVFFSFHVQRIPSFYFCSYDWIVIYHIFLYALVATKSKFMGRSWRCVSSYSEVWRRRRWHVLEDNGNVILYIRTEKLKNCPFLLLYMFRKYVINQCFLLNKKESINFTFLCFLFMCIDFVTLFVRTWISFHCCCFDQQWTSYFD